jgi:hypothetical protein
MSLGVFTKNMKYHGISGILWQILSFLTHISHNLMVAEGHGAKAGRREEDGAFS